MEPNKNGIGGRDTWIMPICEKIDPDKPAVNCLDPEKSNLKFGNIFVCPASYDNQMIQIRRNDEKPLVFTKDAFQNLVEWLKSWDYI
jgi:hypothetical protein